jgi:heme-degrading monooxygenase HmoA
MTSTDPGDRGVLVLITLSVRPEDQQAVLDVLRTAGDPADLPGLRSITLLRAPDGTRVVNQMHWASRAAFEDARAHLPLVGATRARVAELVRGATTEVYELVEIRSGRAAPA